MATTFIVSYIIVVNVVSIFLMYSDKQKAKKNKWRTSERTFFIIALLGGSLGVLLGMQWFRHKTKHLSFKLIIPIISMIQIALVYYLKLWP